MTLPKRRDSDKFKASALKNLVRMEHDVGLEAEKRYLQHAETHMNSLKLTCMPTPAICVEE